VTASRHPLFGLLLAAHHFRRVDGVVFLVVTLPDGSPGTIRADATDAVDATAPDEVGLVLDGEGLRSLRHLVTRFRTRSGSAAEGVDDK
jgi:hypothetical protein